jgi:hypothetical protein
VDRVSVEEFGEKCEEIFFASHPTDALGAREVVQPGSTCQAATRIAFQNLVETLLPRRNAAVNLYGESGTVVS